MKKALLRYHRKNYNVLTPEEKKIVLLISVGQPYHESKYLIAAVNAINKKGFGSCTIALADTLQRYNYSLTCGDADAYNLALKNGQDWLKRNLSIINLLEIPFEIVYWDHWLTDEKYVEYKNAIDLAYITNQEYKKNIDFTIDLFIKRVLKRDATVSINQENFKNSCLKYLKEECAIIMPLWAALDYDYVIYPKPMTPAMENTRNLFVSTTSSKVKWLSMDFK